MAKVQAVPDSYPAVTPALVCNNAAAAIEFYKKVLGATQRMRMDGPGGSVLHCELEIGKGLIMVGDVSPQASNKPPAPDGSSPVTMHVYLADVDAAMKRAMDAGAKVLAPVADQFYGDRNGRFLDPFGHVWMISTHVEDVSEQEMQKRMAAAMGAQA